MNMEASVETDLLISTVRRFVETEMYPHEEEVDQMGYVPEEIGRQIEAKALRKLKHPSRSRKLRSFLDQ